MKTKKILKPAFFLSVGSLVMLPTLTATSCSDIAQIFSPNTNGVYPIWPNEPGAPQQPLSTSTVFHDFSLNENFVMDKRRAWDKHTYQFKDWPSNDRKKIFNEKLITSEFIYKNLDLFIRNRYYNLTQDSIVIDYIMINSVNYVPTIEFGFYFKPNSIYVNKQLNKDVSPRIQGLSGTWYIDPIRVQVYNNGNWIN